MATEGSEGLVTDGSGDGVSRPTHRDPWGVRATVVAVTALVLVVGWSLPAAAAGALGAHGADAGANPTFTSRFTATVNPYTFGQDPSWTADGRVLSNEVSPSGTTQIYVSGLRGGRISCLTCGQPGPNGFPQERPQGDWILFCSFRGQTETFGAPCLGGIGSDLYAMRPDGSHLTRMTGPGSTFQAGGSPYDNYHPSWSPDGRRLVWTHVTYAAHAQGGTQWSILLASFTVDAGGTPHLGAVTPIAPSGDNAYETQVWAPDGSGVLYTSFSSDGDRSVGWLNSELYFLRLHGDGASSAHPQATRLTDGSPAWDEQAVFTPDMQDVIWMSSRGTPSWYQNVVTAAQTTGYDPPFENEVFGPFFVLTVLDPKFRTDLYELDLRTHAVRRLTDLDQVIPEFYFDPTGATLLWTTGNHSRTYVGRFADPGTPVRPARPADPAWIGAPVHGDHTPPLPETATGIDLGHLTVPPQELKAFVLLEQQLTGLTTLLGGLPHGGSCCQAPG